MLKQYCRRYRGQ